VRLLLAVTPIYGHIVPLLGIGRGLVARGHHVSVLTGRKYAAAAAAGGMAFRPLPPAADFDDADLDGWLPGRQRRSRLAAARQDVVGFFVRPLPAQHVALRDELAVGNYDAVLGDVAFLGALPLLLGTPPAGRVPIVGISATPLSAVSVDCAPFGSGMRPGHSMFSRSRNRQIDVLLRLGPLRPVQRALDAVLAPYGVPAGRLRYFDHALAFDTTFQLAPPGFEYPRRELPDRVRFVGPVRSGAGPDPDLPHWWADLDGSLPVVHVTQGTVANADLGQLLVPALRALAGEDVLVVAATGGRPLAALTAALGGAVPANARVAEFLPYEDLLPQTAVMITNGGYGGVVQALRHGVPLVVAGRSEDKPEVAARVAWSGAGLNLRTDRPTQARLRRAVATVLDRPSYRVGAVRLQQQIAALGDPVAAIAAELDAVIAAHAAAGASSTS
jgi:MGT family glycosyltransferase